MSHFTINAKYLNFVREASVAVFGQCSTKIFDFMANPENYRVAEIKSFINTARNHPELTKDRMPSRKDDFVKYARRIIEQITDKDSLNQRIGIDAFISYQSN